MKVQILRKPDFGAADLPVGTVIDLPPLMAKDLVGTGEAVEAPRSTATKALLVGDPSMVSGAGKGLRTVILGDSLAGFNNLSVNISSIVLADGVLTVTTATVHNMRDGQTCNISGTSNNSFHGRLLPITYVSAVVFTCPAPPGAAGTATGGVVLCQNVLNGVGTWVQTNARLGASMRFVANLGVGGQRTDEILARVNEAWALNPDILWFIGGTNDNIQDRAYLATVADIESVVKQATDRGVMVVIQTLPPFASGGPYYTAARNANLLNINSFIRRLATRYRNVYVLDAYAALIQPADVNGYGASAYYQTAPADSVHWNARGASRIGKKGAALLGSVIPMIDNHVTSATDNYGANSGNRDLFDYAPWTNSGSTPTAPATGTLPTGWAMDAPTGTWTVPPAVSCVARSDGLGYDIVVTGTPGGAGCAFTIRTSAASQNARLPLFVGKKYRWLAEVTAVNALSSGIRQLSALANMAVGSASGTIASAFSPPNQLGSLAYDTDESVTLMLPTPEFVIPTGAVANSGFGVTCVMDALSATAVTVKVGSVRTQPMDDQ
ncbi:SGNH/GDSL hydrolase family protein [Paucibacter sp. R3-3]|uniref:SGNH/GDSL hydrolase family protein n=1 Tax=Roseateles agri TaxID=3098619 RepID=A0ABU5DQX7_9BURK|nr:SGNH/GDSL hydrolase family protein [Paucibacter sp. R3-3]MDY0748509.1 SGNH/GDSL hydrolase family protein [Paucibacter sp. R3-3]